MNNKKTLAYSVHGTVLSLRTKKNFFFLKALHHISLVCINELLTPRTHSRVTLLWAVTHTAKSAGRLEIVLFTNYFLNNTKPKCNTTIVIRCFKLCLRGKQKPGHFLALTINEKAVTVPGYINPVRASALSDVRAIWLRHLSPH